MDPVSAVLHRIMLEEGFSSKMYKCPAGYNTIGYGFNLDSGMTKTEALALSTMRLRTCRESLYANKPFIRDLPNDAQEVLLDMAYNMGVEGLLGFKKMWEALEEGNFDLAADEMLDSKWHRDFLKWADGNRFITRSYNLSVRMRKLHGPGLQT